MSRSTSPYDGLDLDELSAMWEQRAHAVELAKRLIDVKAMVRPPRDPFEREWLIAHGQSTDEAEDTPLDQEEVAERRPTRRRP